MEAGKTMTKDAYIAALERENRELREQTTCRCGGVLLAIQCPKCNRFWQIDNGARAALKGGGGK